MWYLNLPPTFKYISALGLRRKIPWSGVSKCDVVVTTTEITRKMTEPTFPAPLDSLAVHIREQSMAAIIKFLTCVEIVEELTVVEIVEEPTQKKAKLGAIHGDVVRNVMMQDEATKEETNQEQMMQKVARLDAIPDDGKQNATATQDEVNHEEKMQEEKMQEEAMQEGAMQDAMFKSIVENAMVPESMNDDLLATKHKAKIRKSDFLKILEDLKKGLVPPIFHALIRGRPCVAFQTKAISMPSIYTVTAAKIPDAILGRIGLKKPNEIIDEFDVKIYLGAEGDNLDLAITKTGAPVPILTDSEESAWEYSHKYANDAARLVNEVALMKGHGVEATALTNLFKIDKAALGDTKYLLTRPESRGVVSSCFDFETTSAIVGSPGIGKSWNLLFALQQALLYDGAVVLLYVCKASASFLFMRRRNTLFAWSRAHDSDLRAKGSLFCRDDVLVLYDPPEVNKNGSGGGAKFSEDARQLIVAMSANDGHDVKAARKTRGGVFHYLGIPSFSELTVMLPLINSHEDINILLSRAETVGRLPRYLVDKKLFKERIADRDLANKEISNIERLNEFIESDGWVLKRNTLPGTLLSVAGDRRIVPEDYNDYEGQHIDYQTSIVIVLNEAVTTAIREK
jgi:hypothetical protein